MLELFSSMGIDPRSIPLIAAGGINSHERFEEVLALGASAAQIGTPFAVTEEGDAHPNFKKVLADAKPDDIVTFMSDAGLPARAVRTPWLDRYLDRADELQQKAQAGRECVIGSDCLIQCGLRDGNPRAGQFCIAVRLAAGAAGRCGTRPLLPWCRAAAVWQCHPPRKRAGRLPADRHQTADVRLASRARAGRSDDGCHT